MTTTSDLKDIQPKEGLGWVRFSESALNPELWFIAFQKPKDCPNSEESDLLRHL